MKKLVFLLLLSCLGQISQLFAQNTYYLQNGKTIYETNGNLLDITRGDSLKILKNVILIKYSAEASEQNIATIEGTNDLVRKYTCSTQWILYTVPDTNEIITLFTSLLNQLGGSKLEFNYQLSYFATPDDPEYPNQWYLPDIMVPEAWDITTGNSAIKVAVLDNGTDWLNGDLGPDNSLGWNFINNNSNTYPFDYQHWHGNMVSAIIAARTNNNLGS
ncbi:MAG: S8 family serine peptidase, partial [Mariniphaga sp.]